MAKAAWETLREMLSAAACEPEGLPGVVASLQTFGSFANFHPHCHILCTEGVLTPDGRFHPVIWPGKRDLEERFRRLFLARLEKAKRLSASFHETLLSWRHSGFSVDASQRVAAGEHGRLERLARYATRVALGVGAVRERPDGRIEIETPPDPSTGARVKVLDRLDFLHAVCQQIPDAKMHQVRYYGAYSCKKRRALRELALSARSESQGARAGAGVDEEKGGADGEPALLSTDRSPPAPPGSAEARRRQSWAQMLRKVFEVDPLVCRRCGEEMVIVAWITKVDVIDRILRHRRERGLVSPFEP
ncbi:MAG: transposase [Planctomycetota bacterium]